MNVADNKKKKHNISTNIAAYSLRYFPRKIVKSKKVYRRIKAGQHLTANED